MLRLEIFQTYSVIQGKVIHAAFHLRGKSGKRSNYAYVRGGVLRAESRT